MPNIVVRILLLLPTWKIIVLSRIFLGTFSGILLVLSPEYAHADLLFIEEAVEVHSIKVKLRTKAHGVVIGKGCAKCPIKFSFDENALLFHGDAKISPQKAKTLFAQPGTIFYDPKNLKVTRIRWW